MASKTAQEVKSYTYGDLKNDLQQLNEEELKRSVIGWRGGDGVKVVSLQNDRQPYWKDEDFLYSQSDYDEMTPEGKESCELFSKTGVTVLIFDF